jgi:hypothetical protein
MEKLFSNQTKTDLKQMVRQLVEGCRTFADDGTVLYTPDGVASYDALWLRDFSYMVEYAPEFVPTEDLKNCILFAQKHKREDGWLPDRSYADGTTCYAAGTLKDPVGKANLDNAPFWVLLIEQLSKRMSQAEFGALYGSLAEDIYTGLSIISLSTDGLVYNDPADPHSPYGFTDTIGKTGRLFFESLLFWRSCRAAEKLASLYGNPNRDWYGSKAQAVEQAIGKLYDAKTKLFLAAELDCRQIDVWGNAYLLYIGFPVAESVSEGILDWFAAHYEDYCYMGQIRHLPKGSYWQRTLIEVLSEEYQNGAYWATASGWVLWCLYQRDASLAERLLREVLDCFFTEGSFECVNEGYRKLNSFVVSATNVYGGLNRLLEEN